MTIGDILAERARTDAGALALIDCRGGRERRLTFRELHDEVEHAAAWLRTRGVRHGHAALVFVPMSADLYVALLALFRLGAVALFLDPSAGRAHLERCCARWPPQLLLAVPKAHALRLISPALRRIRLKISVGGRLPFTTRWLDDRGGRASPAASAAPVAADAALVTFTSGSTGMPKAAVRTHGFLVAQHHALAPSIDLAPGDVDLATLPVFTLANLASGVTTVIGDLELTRPGAIDAARVFEHVERLNVNRITASPAFFERLCEHTRRTGRTLPALRKLHTGGAPVFPRLLDALAELAPHAHRVAVYGSTEAEPIAHVAAGEITADDRLAMQQGRGLLAGPAVEQIAVRILRDCWGTARAALSAAEFEGETVPSDAPGEIVVSGAHVLPGYLGGLGDAETKFTVEGRTWHRTGDAGLRDARGRIWLLGRCTATINDTRGTLYPFTVECVAMTFPEVRRAAVIATAGKRRLIVEGDATCRAALQAAVAWAQIDELTFLECIPVDARHNAKIDYPALRRLLGE